MWHSGMKLDLENNTDKKKYISRIIKKLENDEHYKKLIIAIEKLLKVWTIRQLSIVDKILTFKTLAISKIVHLALVKAVPFGTITQLNKTQREFI